MKILWVKSDLLHPTTKGGHIRTLEMLKRIHQRHEVHYAGFENDPEGEGARRSGEYCSRLFRVPHSAPKRNSPGFAAQLAGGLFSRLPVAISRYRSAAMRRLLAEVIAKERYQSIVCDFITPAPNLPSIPSCVVFQHNVETMIWRRYSQNAPSLAAKLYLKLQAKRMFEFEREVCRAARHVIAVSNEDAHLMQEMFGLGEVSAIPTGVDVESFTPSGNRSRSGLVFVGSMDWLPNVDGMRWFCGEVWPRIRREQQDCTLTIVGREPTREIKALAEQDTQIRVTGTVADVRPYLWDAAVSIVPLRIGGGTRLKIYEAMAARLPVVSTTIGAEGLEVDPPRDIRIADSATGFADQCIDLLTGRSVRESQADAAWNLVSTRFGWDNIARRFESILEAHIA